MIWFADFVTKESFDLVRPGIREGKVRISLYESDQRPGKSRKLLYRFDRQLMDIERGDRLLYSTWQIPKCTAE